MFLNNTFPSQAVVFCGGPREATNIPALVSVNGIPFLSHVLAMLKHNELSDIVLVTGVGGAELENQLGDGRLLGLSIRYFHDEDGSYGSGGSLRALRTVLAPSFFTVRGDRYPLIDFQSLATVYVQHGLPCMMAIRDRENGAAFTNCQLGEDSYGRKIITQYRYEKTQQSRYVEYGVNAMRADLVEQLPDDHSTLEGLYQRNALKGRIGAYEALQGFYHVSDPKGLRQLRDAMVSGAAANYAHLLEQTVQTVD